MIEEEEKNHVRGRGGGHVRSTLLGFFFLFFFSFSFVLNSKVFLILDDDILLLAL